MSGGVFPLCQSGTVMHDSSIKKLIKKLKSARQVLLTTHKASDGDGVGAMMSFYHALTNRGQKVCILTVDPVPDKYHFLSIKKHARVFQPSQSNLPSWDLSLVFDTNDPRQVEPLYSHLKKQGSDIVFIDHHLTPGPSCGPCSIIDTRAASTGEVAYRILKQMDVDITPSIATALYTSVLFDTHRFQFIRDQASSYRICAELYPLVEKGPAIYNQLFCFSSRGKLNLFSEAVKRVEFVGPKKEFAFLQMRAEEFLALKLPVGEACDFIDRIGEVRDIQVAVLILEKDSRTYKLSFRSRTEDMCRLAEHFGGGGHKNAAGATVPNTGQDIKNEILGHLKVRN